MPPQQLNSEQIRFNTRYNLALFVSAVATFGSSIWVGNTLTDYPHWLDYPQSAAAASMLCGASATSLYFLLVGTIHRRTRLNFLWQAAKFFATSFVTVVVMLRVASGQESPFVLVVFTTALGVLFAHMVMHWPVEEEPRKRDNTLLTPKEVTT